MAGALRKMGVYLGLWEDEEHGDGYDDYGYPDEEYEEALPAHRVEEVARPTSVRRLDMRPEPRTTVPAARSDAGALSRITTVHPRAYNDAKQIGEAYRDGTPVIMNVTDMEDSDAKRLVDFAAGLAFGLRGSIEKVTNKVFLLTPANVEVTAEDKRRIAEGGFYNQS